MPTINAAGLNGHGTVLFNGTTQFGQENSTPSRNQPSTVYLVFKQINWTSNNFILDDGNFITSNGLQQYDSSPKLCLNNGSILELSNNLNLNTWGIITLISNDTDSEIRRNLFTSNIGDAGTINAAGITIAADFGLTNFVNCEFAFIIFRNGADPLWLQNNFIKWLKNRFAI